MKKQALRIDFTKLPLEQVTTMLGRMGAELLERLLAGEQPPVLSSLLTPEEKQTLARSFTWKVFRHRPFRRIRRDMRQHLPDALDRLLLKFLFSRRRYSFRTWQKALGDRFALALGGTAGDGLPDALWSLVGERAWKNPGFRKIAAQQVAGYLRQRELFMPFALPAASFSPPVFWLLIALAPMRKSSRGQMFFAKNRAAVRVEQRLHRQAWEQVMEDKWAGFWDQWLIRLAMENWHESFRFLDKRLCRAFMQLPFRFTGALHCEVCTSGPAPPPRAPGKFWARFDGIYRLPGPGKESRAFDFAAPGWQEQMPAFFASANTI